MDAPAIAPQNYCPPKSGEELLSRYAAGERYFGPDASDDRNVTELPYALLEGANLSGADLSEADLTGANLTRANLTRARLVEAQLSDADLSRADLTRCVVDGAIFDGAIFNQANLIKTELKNAASLARSVLTDVTLPGVDLSYANLHRADLSRARFKEVNLFNADLSESNLTDAILSTAELALADLSNANLINALCQDATFFEANLQGAILKGAQLQGSRFEGADLRGADLSDADISGADLSKAALSASDNLLAARWDSLNIDGRTYIRTEVESGEDALPFGMGNPLRFIFQASSPLTSDELQAGYRLINLFGSQSRGAKLALELSTFGQRFLVEARSSNVTAARIGLAVLHAQQLNGPSLAQELLDGQKIIIDQLDQLTSIMADSRLDEVATRRSLESFLQKMDLRQVQFPSEEAAQDFLAISEKAGLPPEKLTLRDRVVRLAIAAQQTAGRVSPALTVLLSGLAAQFLDVPGGFDAGAAAAAVYIAAVAEPGKLGD